MSQATRAAFDGRVEQALADQCQRRTVRAGQDYMQGRQAEARRQLDWEALRDAIEAVRSRTLADLPRYVAQFADNVERRGGHVHFAGDAEEARRTVIALATERGVRLVVKSKSMVTEEVGLNAALEAAGIEVVETDLGEYIIQLAGERPFHIVGPAAHKSVEQIRDLFQAAGGEELALDAAALTAFARRTLRPRFLSAGMGITGANAGVAATGSVVLVTNEGNGRLVSTLPKTHVVVMGVERLVPDFAGLEPLLTALPWAGGGERTTSYTTVISGPRRAGDVDGPDELHVVVVDNGRSSVLGTKYQQVLQCIRCGACLDVCPVYRAIGGHAYDCTYPGPIGAVLGPLLDGPERHPELPFASSLCGACAEVCSARIPLPDLLLELRADAVARHEESPAWAAGLSGFAAVTERPRLWTLALSVVGGAVRLSGLRRPLRRLPGPFRGWTAGRDFPLPAPRSFRELWRRRERSRREGQA